MYDFVTTKQWPLLEDFLPYKLNFLNKTGTLLLQLKSWSVILLIYFKHRTEF